MFKIVTKDDEGIRLDRWLKENIQQKNFISIQKLIRTGQIRVDGSRKKSDYRVRVGDTIRIPPLSNWSSEKPPPKVMSNLLNRRILYEDDSLIVIDKPYGIATQGGTKVSINIDSLLISLDSNLDNKYRLIHRLDKNTTGVMMIAKNRKSAAFYMDSFRQRKIEKEYLALVYGRPVEPEGVINTVSKNDEITKEYTKDLNPKPSDVKGQEAITKYRLVDSKKDQASLICLRPITGRKHQIRKHLKSIGTPIIGDNVYSSYENNFGIKNNYISTNHLLL